MTTIRKILKVAINPLKPLILLFLSMFFDKSFLKGRHFENSNAGFIWAFRSLFHKNILRLSRPMPWPTGNTFSISSAKNISFSPDDLNNFQSPGVYFQNFKAHIYLGKGTYIAPNVGIITANHKLDNLDEHEDGRDVTIGKNCWIGMNSVILPGVTLGDHTIVAAGSVVTKSFPAGAVILGGTPARVLKENPKKH